MPKLHTMLVLGLLSVLGVNMANAEPVCSEAQMDAAIGSIPDFIVSDELDAALREIGDATKCFNLELMTVPPERSATTSVAASAYSSAKELRLYVPERPYPYASGEIASALIAGTLRLAAIRPTGRYEVSFSSLPEGAKVEHAGAIKGTTRMVGLLSDHALSEVRLLMDGYHPCGRNEARYASGQFHCDMKPLH